jgi:ribosome-associated translation inhibitor RaiA
MSPADPQVTVRGDVGERQVEAAVEKLRAACRTAPRPILAARLQLAMEPDPALERPAVAKASVDVSGRVVRAHVACPTMDEAVDRVTDRIRRGIHELAERRRTAERRTGIPTTGEWRHGDLPTARPAYFPRPAQEREMVRTKSVSIGRVTPEEAAFEMAILDHDFHLFTDAGTGADCLIHRTEEGDLALVSPDPQAGRGPAGEPAELPVADAPTMPLADALAQLDESATPFVAFVDADRARLHVAYRRYDGHYGLVAPAEEA